MKFKVGDVIRRGLDSENLYRYVCAVIDCEDYEVTWSASTPSEAYYLKTGGTLSMGIKYVDDHYDLNPEHKRRGEFNHDLEELLSEV